MAKRNYLSIALKGFAMGSVEVVPGISGGTIALIVGVYEELINSIKNIDLEAVKLLFSFKLKEFWGKINGNFLISLVLGMAIAAFSLAKLLKWLLESHPIALWSFFFGLIIASTIIVSKRVPKWTLLNILGLVAGTLSAYLITNLAPATTPNTWWFVLISGAIAACAMILPGISGSFILILLGKWQYMIDALDGFRIGTLLIFIAGAVGGLLGFSHFLSWLLTKHHNITIAALTGFMAGSLNKIWPWKLSKTFIMTSEGTTIIEKNVMPGQYEAMTGLDPQILLAIGLCIVGFALMWGIESISNKMKEA